MVRFTDWPFLELVEYETGVVLESGTRGAPRTPAPRQWIGESNGTWRMIRNTSGSPYGGPPWGVAQDGTTPLLALRARLGGGDVSGRDGVRSKRHPHEKRPGLSRDQNVADRDNLSFHGRRIEQ